AELQLDEVGDVVDDPPEKGGDPLLRGHRSLGRHGQLLRVRASRNPRPIPSRSAGIGLRRTSSVTSSNMPLRFLSSRYLPVSLMASATVSVARPSVPLCGPAERSRSPRCWMPWPTDAVASSARCPTAEAAPLTACPTCEAASLALSPTEPAASLALSQPAWAWSFALSSCAPASFFEVGVIEMSSF